MNTVRFFSSTSLPTELQKESFRYRHVLETLRFGIDDSVVCFVNYYSKNCFLTKKKAESAASSGGQEKLTYRSSPKEITQHRSLAKYNF